MRVSPVINYRQNNLDKCCKPRKMQDSTSEVATGRLDNGDKFLAPKGVTFGYISPLISGPRDAKKCMVRKDPKYHGTDMELYRALRDSSLCFLESVHGSFFGKIHYERLKDEYVEDAKKVAEEFRIKNGLKKDWYQLPNGKDCAHNLRKFGELAKELEPYYDKSNYNKEDESALKLRRSGLEALGEDGDGPMFWHK